MKREEVITEIERYFVFPGQACSYMVGCQSILSLREKAQRALGDKFDLREFHAGKKQTILSSLYFLCSFSSGTLAWIITFEYIRKYHRRIYSNKYEQVMILIDIEQRQSVLFFISSSNKLYIELFQIKFLFFSLFYLLNVCIEKRKRILHRRHRLLSRNFFFFSFSF